MALLKYQRSCEATSRRWTAEVGGWLMVFAALMGGTAEVRAAGVASKEYQVKAVFLFNFAQFVEWPPKAFTDAGSPMVIGVLGEDPFGGFLDDTVRNEKVNNRPIVVERYRRLEEIKTCHILFISRSESDRLDKVMGALKGRNTLNVGDSEEFSRQGGMIRFVTEKSKTRLRIDLEAAKAANLTISSKILRPAEIVNRTKG
jgi:hypothetical protein